MKIKIFLLLTFMINCQILLAKELIIISDLDETTRIANIESKAKAGLKLVTGVKPYEGIRAIFNEIKANNPDAKFYYLSNSFPFLYKANKWIKENGFPEGESFQRCLKDKSADFKPRKLKEIAAAHPDATFLMFGDNVEHDPNFYREFLAETQITDAQVFIRDARLIFTDEPNMTYFQTEAQITDDLNMSKETTSLVNNLAFNKLVPSFLLKNLKKRLIKVCKTSVEDCKEAAERRVLEVIDLIRPATSEMAGLED
jgi:phosphatidate phosphatase APP1